MNDIQVTEVDERDSSWEDDSPRFRVYLHSTNGTDTRGSTATFDITGADVLQVIDWAQRQAGSRLTYAVALVADFEPGGRPGRGLTWLVGMDGNDTPHSPLGEDRQARMLTRRRDPVGVPAADRAPDDLPRWGGWRSGLG
jgi:hypothetical protein